MNHSTPGLPVHHQLPEFTQTHVHQVGDAIQPSHALSSPSPPAPNPSQLRVFSNESTLRMWWAKYWSFSFSIGPFDEHPGVVSFRMDLLAVQGTLKRLLQHHSSKASILRCSAFFTVQLSHTYMTTGKTIALIRWTFVGKVISLLLTMLSRLVISFLPRSNRLLILWLQSTSTVTLEPPKIKSATVSTLSSSISHEVMGPDAMILVFWREEIPIYKMRERTNLATVRNQKSNNNKIQRKTNFVRETWGFGPQIYPTYTKLFYNKACKYHKTAYHTFCNSGDIIKRLMKSITKIN